MNSNGVRKFQPGVASTLGTNNRNDINSEGVRERFQRCVLHTLKPRVEATLGSNLPTLRRSVSTTPGDRVGRTEWSHPSRISPSGRTRQGTAVRTQANLTLRFHIGQLFFELLNLVLMARFEIGVLRRGD